MRKYLMPFLLLLTIAVGCPLKGVADFGDALRVTPLGYRIGERGDVVSSTSSEVVEITPSQAEGGGPCLVYYGDLPMIFTAKAGFGYKVVGWQVTTNAAVRGVHPKTEIPSDPKTLEVAYRSDVNWVYLVVVMEYDNNRTVTLAKTPFGEGTIGTNYGVYACQKGDVFKLRAVPKHDNATGYDCSTFRRWSDGVTSNSRTIIVDGNATYVAEFVPNSWRATFDPCGGELAVSSKWVTCGATYGRLPTPVRTGHAFSNWYDKPEDGAAVTPGTTVGAVGDHTLYAYWDILRFTLTAQSEGEGSGTFEGPGEYEYGTIVSLLAKPVAGSTFAVWTDGETRNPREVTLVSNMTYVARFDCQYYTVKFDYRNAVGDVVSKVVSDLRYNAAVTPPSLEEVNGWTGHHFKGWSTDGYLAVQSDLVVSAEYDVERYTIDAVSSGEGSGTFEGTGEYDYGKVISLVAKPAPGSSFECWTDGVTKNPRDVTVVSNATYTASFARQNYVVKFDYRDAAGDIVTVVHSNVTYGTKLTAPGLEVCDTWTGHPFKGWSTDEYLDVHGDLFVTAKYEAERHTLSAVSDPDGEGSGTFEGVGEYDYGQVVSLKANPVPGCSFVCWSDGETKNPREVTVVSNMQYTARFALQHYVVKFDYRDAEGDIVTVVHSNVTYGAQLTAPGLEVCDTWTGHPFKGWSTDEYLDVRGDLFVTAKYEAERYTLSAVSDPGGEGSGTFTGVGEYDYGKVVSLRAVPVPGCTFVTWTDGETKNPREITVTSNATYVAQFALQRYTVKFDYRNAAGDVVSSVHSNVTYGASLTPPALEDCDRWTGHPFKGWSTDEYLEVRGDLVVTAKYESERLKVIVLTDGTGTGTASGAGEYAYGDLARLQAKPDTGFGFAGWADGVTRNPREEIVISNATYTALFQVATNNVTFTYRNAAGVWETTEPQPVAYGAAALPPTNHNDWAEHAFSAWSSDAWMEVKEDLTGPRTITAIYDDEVLNVAFAYYDAVGNWVTSAVQHVVSGGSATPPPASVVNAWKGNTFRGWYPDYTVIRASAIISAVYDADMHTVTFSYRDTEGAEAIYLVSVANGGSVSMDVVAPLKDLWEDHTFSRWIYSDGTTVDEKVGIANVTSDMKISAVYSSMATIIYHANDGTGKTDVQVVQITGKSTKVKLQPNAFIAPTGYVFDSWTNSVGKAYANEAVIEVKEAEEVDLYAKWRLVTYTVRFDKNAKYCGLNGYCNIDPVHLKYFDEKVVDYLGKVGSDEHDFLGWNRNQEAKEPEPGYEHTVECKLKLKNLTTTDGDVITFYAIWE